MGKGILYGAKLKSRVFDVVGYIKKIHNWSQAVG